MALKTGSVVCDTFTMEASMYMGGEFFEANIQYRVMLGGPNSLDLTNNYDIDDVGYQVAKQFVVDYESRNPNVAEDIASGKIRKITFAREE